MPNQLQFERSPYLLQHKDQPVQWRPWGSEAFAAAREENKPVFLSVGYSTCHWCHVMAHESFEDEAVAAVLNRGFISIKVDREERPDVDAVYMDACLAMTGKGGWPLTVLLTPELKPFWVGTYLPKEVLLSLLNQAEQMWQTQRTRLTQTGEQLARWMRQERQPQPGAPSRRLVQQAAAQFAGSFDRVWGGFGSAPKFPMAHNLIFLMEYSRRSGDRQAMDMAEKTLEAMYRGGLFDHIGGGFSRYSTDRQWLVPHFEKMLYDNALLLYAYAVAFQHTRRPLYKTVAQRTAEYVLRELTSPEGGFFCGQDADSEGVEGKYYLLQPEELQAELGDARADAFCRWYGVTGQGNFEGRSIPNLLLTKDFEREPEGMEATRERLRLWRERRTALHKDDKILTAWNGLMIAALAKAGTVLGEERYLTAARRAAAFLETHLTRQGCLLARWREGHSAFDGKLDDYAFYGWGLLELYGATLDLQYLAQGQTMAEHLLAHFFDREAGGLYPYAAEGEQLITRNKTAYDGAIPSGNGAAALVFSRLARLTGKESWRAAAKLQGSWLAGAAEQVPSGHSFAMLTFLEELWPSAELVCAGQEAPVELRQFLGTYTGAPLSVLVKVPQTRQALSELAPFTVEYPIPGQGTQYYLCTGGACMRPTEDLAELKARLESL